MTTPVSQKPSINVVPDTAEENSVPPPAFPPYPPYATTPAPASVADTIVAGRDLRLLHKSLPKKPVRPLPKPAKPKGPAAGDLKLSRRRWRAHAQCLRKHNIVLSDRLEQMAKPQRRAVMYLWRDHGHHLAPETIARMRAMLDADEPFKPAQAYEYFINQRKSTKRQKEVKVKSIKQGIQSTCGDKRQAWARNATVLFARGIQHRLSRPGSIVLTDGMLRLSNVILGEIFGFLHIKKPSRRSTHPKARFIMDISDRIAIWIDDILSEADDRMLMMDFDEDDEVEQSTVDERLLPSSVGSRSTVVSSGPTTATPVTSTGTTPAASKSKVDVTTIKDNNEDHFTDDFINVMGDVDLQPAYLKFQGEMSNAFNVLVDVMDKKGDTPLINLGTFTQTYKEASDSLKNATNLDAREFDVKLLKQLRNDLSAAVGSITPAMKEVIEKCSKYLAEQAVINNVPLSIKKHRDSENGSTSLSETNMSFDNNNAKKIHKNDLAIKKNKDNIHEAVRGSKSLPDIKRNSNSRMKIDIQEISNQCKAKDSALQILHKQLRSHGTEIFHEQPPTVLTHSQASDWLSKDLENEENKIIPYADDISFLSKIFKKKLSNLVNKATPENLREAMQVVVVQSSKKLAEQFLIENYKNLVKDALISEMQHRRNEILISIDKNEETTFFAAQRLKKAKSLKSNEPDSIIASSLVKKLKEIVRCIPIARKLLGAMQEHIIETSFYLSEHIFDHDIDIEAYIILLKAMDAYGNAILVEEASTLTYSDASEYLKELTSFDDKINKPNQTLQPKVENKLKTAVDSLPHSQFDKNAMKGVIKNSAKLLVSYIALQGEKTEYLKALVQIMENEVKDNVLLRHGIVCRSYSDAIELLKDKTIGELSVSYSDPIVKQKIQLKLQELMSEKSPTRNNLMNEVIEEVAKYLAVHLIQSLSQKVCLCRSVQVQCEMWSNGMIRKVSRHCCFCARRARRHAVPDLSSEREILSQSLEPTPSRSCGNIISIKHCPAREMKKSESMNSIPCPAKDPKCTPSYLLYNISNDSPKRLGTGVNPNTQAFNFKSSANKYDIKESLFKDIYANSNYNYDSNPKERPTKISHTHKIPNKTVITSKYLTKPNTTDDIILKSGASDIENIHASIISANHMSELQALFTAIIWNLQIWGHWVQEIVDLAINCPLNKDWIMFKERILCEALQWRQYNIFIRQLIKSLCYTYNNTRIVSPIRVRNINQYKNYEAIEEVVNISFKWSQWMSANIKQADSVKNNYKLVLNNFKWNYFRSTIKEYLAEWVKCCLQLKLLVDKNFSNIISEWSFKTDEPVWIISAYGVVPSGAVEAGVSDDEVIWVARAVHDNAILPAALHSSKHRCIVYADGKTVVKTKYQVMCNTKTKWLPCRAGTIAPGAVTVVPGVYIGRVHHRGCHYIGPVSAPDYGCHVGICGRPTAFNCYELLVY